MKIPSNTVPVDQYKAACKLIELVTWLENNRHHFTAILHRGQGAPCYATVMQEWRNLNYEIGQWLLAVKGRP